MRVVVDSNRVIASLIKDSTTRQILFDKNFYFIAPDFITTEINKYREEIMGKAILNEEEFDILISIIFENIEIVPEENYKKHIESFKSKISDEKDIPYLAVALNNYAAGIWTHDPHFLEQNMIKVFTNKDLLEIIRLSLPD